ncbi:hypothetical protein [Paenibacillus sp. OAS669]|uniref:hypothetical protein n=1 Tax=Paenibacillus sp. OAS669 TaxID=2663821 RepID=UPI00178C0E35|nr:hypothetical protein [Paenibacillus sp. OAS669]MBE1444813.1 hypothetical protein [Paenibacillus sp. OAS669]
MNRYLILSVVFGFILVLLPILPSSCFACSCAFQRDPIKALDEAGAVFSGKVIEMKEDVWENRKKGEVYEWRHVVRIAVEQSWKGMDQTEVIVMTNAGGEDSCGYEFKVGESYLVYAYKNNSTGVNEWHTSYYSRTALLSSASGDLEKIGQGSTPSERVNLSEQMNEYEAKNYYYLYRRYYQGWIKPYLYYIVPVVLLMFVSCFYVIIKRRRK